MDIVPYFSRNTGSLDGKKVAKLAKTDPALKNHQRVMKDIISTTHPKIIHLNGSHSMHAFEKLLEPRLELQEKFKKYKLKFGHVEIEGLRAEVLAHNQFAPGAFTPNPYDKYWPLFIEAWRKWNLENS